MANFVEESLKGRPTVMSFVDPITKDPKEFPLDVSMKIDTSIKAKVTSFPVEGSIGNVTDHVQPSPLRLSLNGMISQSPTQLLLTAASSILQKQLADRGKFTGLTKTFTTAALAAGVSRAASLGGSGSSTSFAQLLTVRGESDPEFPKKAMQGLIEMFKQGTPFTLRTYFQEEIYLNMVMDSISFPQNATSGDSLMFMMSCTKVEIVKSVTSKNELSAADPAGSSAAENSDDGGIVGKAREILASEQSIFSSLQ